MFDEFASGGMAAVHWGRARGASGFSRLVAIKRLHPQFAKDADFVAMFLDEARVAGRIQHPNVVSVIDVIRDERGVGLVMDYVHGEPLSRLLKRSREVGRQVPAAVAVAIVAQALHGLHAAHETLGDEGELLAIVHRDVSPQNILVGADGVARVVDFGIAKALGRSQETAEGVLKGKAGYFAPEQLKQETDRRTDVFAAGIVLWECLKLERLFTGDTHWEIVQSVLTREIPDPAALRDDVPPELGAAILKGLSRDLAGRFETARAFALALEQAIDIATPSEVAAWIEDLAGRELNARRERMLATNDLAEVAPPPSERAASAAPTRVIPREPKSAGPKSAGPRSRTARTTSPLAIAFIVTATVIGLGGVAFGTWALTRPGAPVEPPSSAETVALPPASERAPEVAASQPSVAVAADPPPSSSAAQTPARPPRPLRRARRRRPQRCGAPRPLRRRPPRSSAARPRLAHPVACACATALAARVAASRFNTTRATAEHAGPGAPAAASASWASASSPNACQGRRSATASASTSSSIRGIAADAGRSAGSPSAAGMASALLLETSPRWTLPAPTTPSPRAFFASAWAASACWSAASSGSF